MNTLCTTIPRPLNEADRLAAVRRYRLLDTPAEADFDFLTKMVATICGTPYAYVSLVDDDRVWYKSSYGNPVGQSPRDANICAWTILEDSGMHIADLSQDQRTASLRPPPPAPEYRMYHGVNLVSSDGFHIGTLCVLDVAVRALAPETLKMLSQLASQVMALIELRARSEQLEATYVAMERLATIDELTGLFNRRALMAQLQKEIQRSERTGQSFAMVMIDLDYFKRINDEYGHLCGDAVLREIGALIRQRLRAADSAGRYGGEELALLLFDTTADEAGIVAQDLRAAIAAGLYAGGRVKATASFGIALFQAGRQASADQLIEAADQALFTAKRLGRNRVEVHHAH